MPEILTFSLTAFIGFFAIMNPIANIPVFIGLVEGADKEAQARITKTATVTAFIIILCFVIIGKFIFEIFGITIPAFKITGGILVFFVGFEMLQSKRSNVKNIAKVEIDEEIAISPLAIPMLAGPGTIVTAMNYVTDADAMHITMVLAMAAVVCALNWIAFRGSNFIVRKIGNNVIRVFGKIMGLIIAIVGTNMIIEGLKLAFPVLN